MSRAWKPLIVIGAALVAASCESTPLLIPSDGQILMTADPVIAEERSADPNGNALFSTIDATVLSADGQVLPGVQVTFTRSGGRLCLDDTGCLSPQEGPLTLDTDANGRARVVLGVTENDPAAIDVIARSGAKEATINVTNPIGEALPLAVTINVPAAVDCEIAPTEDCVYNFSPSFSAQVTNATSPITCYRWALTTSVPPNPAAQFGPTLTTYSPPAFTSPQQVDAAVSVTDEAGPCDTTTTFEATGTRTIHVCDSANQPPTANIATVPPGQTSMSLGGGTSVTFNLTGAGSTDPNATPANQLTYRWDCGNGTTPTGITASCTYNSATPPQKTVSLTVFDVVQGEGECARRGTAQITLTVNP